MAQVSRFLDPSLVERLNQLQVSARSVVEGNTVGLHRSPVKGASIEFRQHLLNAHAAVLGDQAHVERAARVRIVHQADVFHWDPQRIAERDQFADSIALDGIAEHDD